jgi:transposase
VLSGIIFINRNGLRWSGAPKEYGSTKTLYNRLKRWVDMGVFARMMEGLASEAAVQKMVMIDATYAHRILAEFVRSALSRVLSPLLYNMLSKERHQTATGPPS